MEITVEQPRAWSRRLTIKVPADRIRQERDVVVKHYAKRIKLPGFRKGKVPRTIVEQRYGPVVEQETLERVLNSAYRDAIRQEGLDPITQGSIDNVDYEPGSDLTFNVELEVRPEIELERLGGFTVRRETPRISDEEIDRVLDRLRDEQAVWRPVEEERTPESGELVQVQITPIPDEADPENEPKPRPYEILLGEGHALPAVEEAIQSLTIGEEREFALDLPEEAEETPEGEEPPTRTHRVIIKLDGAKTAELPELDDAFARSVASVETMDALRSRIREDLAREAESESERGLRRQIMDQVLEANPFEVPDAMVRQYLDRLIQPKEGADPEQVEKARESAWPAATHAIRRMLAVERIAASESLHATDADVDVRIEALAEEHDRPAADIRRQLVKSGQMDALRDEISEDKVFEYLLSLSKVEEAR